MKVLMNSNVYKIPERLKEIDGGYFVLFNRANGKYEVHSTKNNGGNTYCLTVPYNELDSRTIDLVQKTKVENARKIYEDMKRHNEMLEIQEAKRYRDYIDATAKDIHKYIAPKQHIDRIPDDAYSTRFI